MTPDDLIAQNPYPGLRPFAISESDLFFGRQRQIEELVARLDEATLIAVAGASGCGKSSLVLAGLLHALAARRAAGGDTEWRPIVMRPGNHPIANLATPLADVLSTQQGPGDAMRAAALEGRLRLSGVGLAEAVRLARLPQHVRVLVVVDQFEEIFRFRRMTDPEEATAFVKLVLHAAYDPASPVSVVLTLRSDTLGYTADFRDLPEAISHGQYLVPRLTRDQRKDAIVGPVELRGVHIAPRLVQRVLNDVSDDFDDLPVMQHALSRTWRSWAVTCAGTRPIDIDDYNAIGTAARALSIHADEAYASLPGRESVVEKVFRALTERVGGDTEVRRPLQFEHLCKVTGAAAADVAEVVERYRRADTVLLLPPSHVPLTSNPVIDISHESLIRNWTRLRQWADVEAQSAQMYRRLADAAGLYARNQGGLLRDPALQFALEWRDRNQPNAAWAALYDPRFDETMRFLDASREARDQERLAAARAATRKRSAVLLTLFASIAAAVTMAYLWRESVQSRDRAESAQQESLSRQLTLAANAELAAGRVDRALLLSVAAMKRKPTEEAQDVLRTAIESAPRRFLAGHKGAVSSVAFSPDGKQLASASLDGTVIRWDAASGDLQGTLVRDPANSPAVVFADDGAMLASPSQNGTAIVWTATGGEKRPMLNSASDGAAYQIVDFAIDPDRGVIAFVDGDNAIRLWDMTKGTLRAVYKPPPAAGDSLPVEIKSLAISPNGETLAAGTSANTVMLWNVATGKQQGTWTVPNAGAVTIIAFSPDAKLFATGHADGAVVLWDARTVQARVVQRKAHRNQVDRLAFSHDSARLASGGWDNAVLLWDTATGERIGNSDTRHRDHVARLAFGPNGVVASASLDGTIMLWDTETGERIGAPLRAHHDQVTSIAFSPDGHTLASAGRDSFVILWDVADRTVGRSLRRRLQAHPAPVTSVAFAPDGKLLAVGAEDSGVYLWNLSNAHPTNRRLGLHEDQVLSVAFSPDGHTIASGSEDSTVRLWDVGAAASSEEVAIDLQVERQKLSGHQDKVTAVAFNRDGSKLVSGSRDKNVILWNLSPQPVTSKVLKGHTREVRSVAFSADGKLIASGGEDHAIRLWDAVTGGLIRELPNAHANDVTSVAFSPDSQMLASGSSDETVKLWNVGSGGLVELATFRSAPLISSVAFSPDGKMLVAGGSELRLWDVQKREPVGAPLSGHTDNIYAVAFRPDGTALATGGLDQTIMLWDPRIGEWQGTACAIVKGMNVPWSKNQLELLKDKERNEVKDPCGANP